MSYGAARSGPTSGPRPLLAGARARWAGASLAQVWGRWRRLPEEKNSGLYNMQVYIDCSDYLRYRGDNKTAKTNAAVWWSFFNPVGEIQ